MAGRVGHEDIPGGGSVFWLELPLMPSVTRKRRFRGTKAELTDKAYTAGLRVRRPCFVL
jgi:hypothetical protein